MSTPTPTQDQLSINTLAARIATQVGRTRRPAVSGHDSLSYNTVRLVSRLGIVACVCLASDSLGGRLVRLRIAMKLQRL